ncbi:MAG: helix-turn-helix domain-containing protein [Actinomycetota bacterium]
MLVTVPQAARRTGKNPETIRRWIRSGRLPAQKVGTQHLIDEEDLEAAAATDDECVPLPAELRKTWTGRPMPNPVRAIHLAREGH